MQLLRTVQKNSYICFFEQLSLFLSVSGALVYLFLYGEYTGFLKGEEYALSAYVNHDLMEKFEKFFSMPQDDYLLISNSYLIIFIAFLVVLVIHFFGKGILSRWLNLIVLCLPIFQYWQIFNTKLLAWGDDELSRFDLMRETIFLDVIGAANIGCLIVIQLLLAFLVSREKKRYKSS